MPNYPMFCGKDDIVDAHAVLTHPSVYGPSGVTPSQLFPAWFSVDGSSPTTHRACHGFLDPSQLSSILLMCPGGIPVDVSTTEYNMNVAASSRGLVRIYPDQRAVICSVHTEDDSEALLAGVLGEDYPLDGITWQALSFSGSGPATHLYTEIVLNTEFVSELEGLSVATLGELGEESPLIFGPEGWTFGDFEDLGLKEIL